MSNKLKRKQIDGKLTEGPLNSAYGINNTPNILNNDIYEVAFDKIVTIIDKLIPTKPPKLSDVDMIYTGTFYTAYITNSTTLINNIINTTLPIFKTPNLTYFGDATKGSLKFNDNALSLNLTINDDTNNNISVNGKIIKILNDIDYYINQPSKAGFWNAMEVAVEYTALSGILSSTTPYSYTLENWTDINGSGTLDSSITKTFYVENITHPTTSNVILDPITPYTYTSNKKISGVPVFSITDTIRLRFDMSRVSKHFYINNPILISSTSNTFIANSVWNWSTPPLENSNQTNELLIVKPVANKYINNISISIAAKDAINQTSAYTPIPTLHAQKLRIDTISNETTHRRIASMTNLLYDKTFTNLYDTNEVIVGNPIPGYNYELQLLGGNYKYPTANFSPYYPINTINYSGQTGMRYAMFYVGTVTNTKQIIINTPGISSILKGSSSLSIHVIVENLYGIGNHGWVDACTDYYTSTAIQQYNINNAIDGALGLINGSTAILRTVTVHTGNITYGGNTGSTKNVYVKIGWSNVNNFTLSSRPTIAGVGGGGSFISA